MLSFFSAKGVEGLQRGGQCAILRSEIRAALRAATLAKAFRTYRRHKKAGKHIRAAKCHFDTDGTRLPAARISKPHPRKGTETSSSPPYSAYTHPRNFKTTSPQGDGNFARRSPLNRPESISKPHPRKGTERTNPSLPCHSGGGGPRSGGRGALNDPRISIVRKSRPLQAPPPARTARHLPRFDGGGK